MFGLSTQYGGNGRALPHMSTRRNISCAKAARSGDSSVTLLDYGAGNIRSIKNAIKKLGYSIKEVESPRDIASAEKLIFPGVGAFGQAMDILKKKGYLDPLRDYILEDKPFFGICIGMQVLFEGSEEDGGSQGLGIIPGVVGRFDSSQGLQVPHIGWNTLSQRRESRLLSSTAGDKRVYFVHSYRAVPTELNDDWVLATCNYGSDFIASVNAGNVYATQFHPEKSGLLGLDIIDSFLSTSEEGRIVDTKASQDSKGNTGLAKRVIACLDVRANDQGDLVVTKGDQYDVRESDEGSSGNVRNLGKPVELAQRYFDEGADEVTFLNITGFRDFPLGDLPMLEVLKQASENVFVPLTVGGGIRGFTDANGKHYSALEVAAEYFRSGADKVSIGGDAVMAAEEYMQNGNSKSGTSCIEQISKVYGAQAVVISIDPKRVYVQSPKDTHHNTVKTSKKGPNGEEYCWWQCTIKGGREGRDIDVVELATISETLGAGEILLNCIDNDGAGQGFDIELVKLVSDAVSIPVIASSGAGSPDHFTEVFEKTVASAGLAAGIFHREEVSIHEVKEHMVQHGIPSRL